MVVEYFPLSLSQLATYKNLIFCIVIFTDRVCIHQFIFTEFMRYEGSDPGFGIFVKTFEQRDSKCILYADIGGGIIHHIRLSWFDVRILVIIFQLVVGRKFALRPFHLHRVDETGDGHKLLLRRQRIIFLLREVAMESQFVALRQEYIAVSITGSGCIHHRRHVGRFIHSSTFCCTLGIFDIIVVRDTSVLVVFQVVVAIQQSPFVFLSHITDKRSCVEV